MVCWTAARTSKASLAGRAKRFQGLHAHGVPLRRTSLFLWIVHGSYYVLQHLSADSVQLAGACADGRRCSVGRRRVRLVGLLKTGRKSLFLRGASNAYCSQQPLCVLDFFVLPQNQRQGIGQALFQVGQVISAMQGGGCESGWAASRRGIMMLENACTICGCSVRAARRSFRQQSRRAPAQWPMTPPRPSCSRFSGGVMVSQAQMCALPGASICL